MGYNVYGAAMLAFAIDLTFIYMASMLYDIPYDNVQSRHCSLTTSGPSGFPGRHLSVPWVIRDMHWV